MSFAAVEQIARAVLYEGYLLYPYRPTALKNRQRWMFGRLLPHDYCLRHSGSEYWLMQTECLVVGDVGTSLELLIRFLQLAETGDEDAERAASDTLEREVKVAARLGQIVNSPHRVAFSFRRDLDVTASPVPRSADVRITPLEGTVVVTAVEVYERLFKLTVVIENLTSCDALCELDLDQALLRSLISTHTMLRVQDGEFVSLLDPPEPYADLATTCRNVGAWPVLVGPEKGRMMLSSPIILSDDPQISPESPGDLFDGTEIDELLTLRIQTLTDEEKARMSAGNAQARLILQRTEALTEDQLRQMHGRFTRAKSQQRVDRTQRREDALPTNSDFQPGERVRLQPRGRADAFDLLLKGQLATIISIERDFEHRVHLCVVLDDDPGKDFGEQGLPGHRFFFNPEEVERLE
jgi:hypothetical protein